jgi:hypothetical protein
MESQYLEAAFQKHQESVLPVKADYVFKFHFISYIAYDDECGRIIIYTVREVRIDPDSLFLRMWEVHPAAEQPQRCLNGACAGYFQTPSSTLLATGA